MDVQVKLLCRYCNDYALKRCIKNGVGAIEARKIKPAYMQYPGDSALPAKSPATAVINSSAKSVIMGYGRVPAASTDIAS